MNLFVLIEIERWIDLLNYKSLSGNCKWNISLLAKQKPLKVRRYWNITFKGL